MDQLELLKTPVSWVFLLLGFVVCLLNKDRIRQTVKNQKPDTSVLIKKKQVESESSEAAYYAIEPHPNFNLSTQEELKLRPFKPKFHMTMALETTTLSDLIPIDKTYPRRLALRRHLLATHRAEVLACTPIAFPAVLELYVWLTRTYLPLRYPSIFTLDPSRSTLLNRVTTTHLPLQPSDAETALQILGENIDDEFLILLPEPCTTTSASASASTSPTAQEDNDGGIPKYRLQAFITCFPSGFRTLDKLCRTLSEIHGPVPQYAEKLEKSMDRYFASLPVGKVVKRANWSVSTSGELFCLQGNHMSVEELEAKERGGMGMEMGKEGIQEEEEVVDLNKTVVRCERQTLHRLPRSGALVFAFKTYQYPIKELRDEGSGEVLAEAIDGLGLGSVPGMTVYKRQVVWGEKVKAYLRGEIEA